MSIANYIFPQNRLYQYLTNIAQPSDVLRTPVVIGARYLLSRYGKETVPTYSFAAASADQTLPFSYINEAGTTSSLTSSEVVDNASVKVFLKDAEATLATSEDDSVFQVLSAAQANVLKICAGEGLVRKTGTGGLDLNSIFDGRNCEVGDLVYLTDVSGGTTSKRTISGFIGADVASSVSDLLNSLANPETSSASFTATSVPSGFTLTCATPANFNGLLQGAAFIDTDGKTYYGEKFSFKVTLGGDNTTAQITVTSESGKFGGVVTSTAGADDTQFSFSGTALGGLTVLVDAGTGTSLTASTTTEYKFKIKGAYTRLANTKIVESGTFTGASNTTYTVEVITGTASGVVGAVVRVADSAGLEQATEVTIAANNTNYSLGTNGLSFKFDFTTPPNQGGLRKGDVYYLTATAATQSGTHFDKIVLNGPAVNTSTFTDFSQHLYKVEFRKSFSGYVDADANESGTAWTISTNGVIVDGPFKVSVAGRISSPWCSLVNGIGSFALSYRALKKPAAGSDIIIISDSADISAQLGKVDLDNDAAFATSECFSGAQGLKVYVLLVEAQTAAAYAEVLKKIRFRRNAYALSPVTSQQDIIQAVVAHCDAMSSPTKKFFRRCYYGVDSPGSYSVLTTFENVAISGTISDYLGTGNRLVTLSDSDIQVDEYGLQPGDLVKLPVSGEEYTIQEILPTNQILLTSGPTIPVAVAVTMALWRANTPDSQSDYVRGFAKTIANRRAVQVWTENGKRYINGNLTIIPNKYIAAHVAGLRCALPKQRGLTRTEITTVSDCAAMYLRYSSEALDAIAADGTFIVTQDAESGLVYIRHQLTTDVNNGSLAYEDNIGVIVDELSFKTDDIVGSYIGKRNLTFQTLNDLLFALRDMLFEETQTDVDNDFGPALIRFEGLKIVPDLVLKDRAKIFCKWIVPLPFNLGDTYITVDQDVTLNAVEIA